MGFQSDSSRTDSPVRILHAQPRSRLKPEVRKRKTPSRGLRSASHSWPYAEGGPRPAVPAGKRVELVKEMLPGVSRIGLLQNMGNPVVPPQWDETLATARTLGITAELLDVRNEQDVSAAFEAALRLRIGALLVGIDGFIQSNSQAIVGWAARHRVPAVYPSKEFADAGGLMTYGISYPDLYFRAASFVDRIFKGAKPGDLPIQTPTSLSW